MLFYCIFIFFTNSCISYHQISSINTCYQMFYIIGLRPIITIHKSNPFSFGIVQTKIAGGAYSPILLMEYTHTGIFLGVLITDFT